MISILILIGAFLYFLLPIDFIPEILFGPFGYIDDVLVLIFAVFSFLKK